MGAEAREYVMCVLPRGCSEDERSVSRDVEEDIHTLALTGDESVPCDWINRNCASQFDTTIC